MKTKHKLSHSFALALASLTACGELTAKSLCSQEKSTLELITPTIPVDYIALRVDSMKTPQILEQVGTPCSSAEDKPTCLAALAAPHFPSWWTEEPSTLYLGSHYVWTRGDTVGFADSISDLAGFLSPIENPNDALFLAQTQGYYLDCNWNGKQGQSVKQGENWEIVAIAGDGCGKGNDIREVVIVVHPDGTVTEKSRTIIQRGDPRCSAGRRFESLPLLAGACASELAATLSEMAYLEAASVDAFLRLATELRSHGAPVSFVKRAQIAAKDEVRHARSVKKLAEKYGGVVHAPPPGPMTVRSLLEIAKENAEEGCVRETFGALIAEVQSRSAKDQRVRKLMAIIAKDEREHAELAWDIKNWIDTKLSFQEKKEVFASLEGAKKDLLQALHSGLANAANAEDWKSSLGLPSRSEQNTLLRSLEKTLWVA